MNTTRNLNCRICGEKTGKKDLCQRCAHLTEFGSDEITIRTMLKDDRSNNIWRGNKIIATALADAYYESVLALYEREARNDSKENFGYNSFSDGANMVLDIIMPLLDETARARVNHRIDRMIEVRRMHKEKKMENKKK